MVFIVSSAGIITEVAQQPTNSPLLMIIHQRCSRRQPRYVHTHVHSPWFTTPVLYAEVDPTHARGAVEWCDDDALQVVDIAERDASGLMYTRPATQVSQEPVAPRPYAVIHKRRTMKDHEVAVRHGECVVRHVCTSPR
jgi:hypothetical protein